jgi:cobalt-zinc-cadmium resistance protein CzcA
LERADDKLKAWISDMDLCTLQDWTVRLILRTAPGVDHVTSWGGQERQYQMRIDPLKLIAYDLDYSDVIAAVDANNRQIGGQYIDRAPNSTWCVHSGW